MFRLPVSGLPVVVRQPTGAEDVLLQETAALDVHFALNLLDRLVRDQSAARVNLDGLSVTDFEALLLVLRRVVLGDLVRAETKCSAAGCSARVDASFRIGDYLTTRKIRTPRGVEKSDSDGWFHLAGQDVKFRLPNCADLKATESLPNPEREFVLRCIQPASVPVNLRSRIDRAMETMAPRFSRMLSGECPECRGRMNFFFDVKEFVLRELRSHAGAIYHEVHLLALHYNWPEEKILALPRNRRAHYAAALRGQRN